MRQILSLVLIFFITHNTIYAKSDQKLLLMYDSFIYTKDLKNAYKVAKIALKKEPNSILWHQKLAKVAKWLGRDSEYAKAILFVYNKQPSKELENEIVEYFIKSYRFSQIESIIKKRALNIPNQKNSKNLQFIYQMIGYPTKAAKIFKTIYEKTSNIRYLNIALSLYMQEGDLKSSAKIVKILEKNNIPSLALSKYYFLNAKPLLAYKTLLKLKDQNLYQDPKFLQYLSDLALYFHDKKVAAFSSQKLLKLNQAKISNYQAIIDYYQNIDNKIVKNISFLGFKKYKRDDFFYNYAYFALKNNLLNDLEWFIKKIKKSNLIHLLKNNPQYWLILAKAYNSPKAFKKALKLSNNDPNITLQFLWNLMDNKRYKELKKELNQIEKQKIDISLYQTLALANLTLQRVDKAAYYINQLLKLNPNNIEYKLLKSWQLYLQKDTQAYNKLTKEIYLIMDKSLQKDPLLIKKPNFLKQYLKVSIYFKNPDEYKKILKASKNILNHQEYQELNLLYSWHHSLFDQIQKINNSLQKSNPSLQMDMALRFKDYSKQQYIFKTDEPILSTTTKIAIAKENLQISNAIKYAQDGLNENQNDIEVKKELYNLYIQYANNISISTNLLYQNSLNIHSYTISNISNIFNQYRLKSTFTYSLLKKIDQNILNTQLSNYKEFDIGIDKIIKNGYFDIGIYTKKILKSYLGFYLLVNYVPNLKNSIYFDFKINSKDNQSSPHLLLGGKKDQIKTIFTHNLSNNLNLKLDLEMLRYKDINNLKLANGYITTFQLEDLIPITSNLKYTILYTIAKFEKKSVNNSAIYNLIPKKTKNIKIIPENFNLFGLGVFYKKKSTQIDSFKPYIDMTLLYDIQKNNLYTSIQSSFNTTFWKKNILNITLNYNNSIKVVDQYYFNITFKLSRIY